MSHVQLHHHSGEEARASVTSALASSARITTTAALIMASVFASFILKGDPTIKHLGVELSVAVRLAGILVVTLAPAILSLFGRLAWWLPRWLDRILPHVSIEGEAETAPSAAAHSPTTHRHTATSPRQLQSPRSSAERAPAAVPGPTEATPSGGS